MFRQKLDLCFFECIVTALRNTTPGRCRRLKRLQQRHSPLIQERTFKKYRVVDSRFSNFRKNTYLCMFECLITALRKTTPGHCRRLKRLQKRHSPLIQEPHFKKYSVADFLIFRRRSSRKPKTGSLAEPNR